MLRLIDQTVQIVGAGVAGLTAALALAQRGAKVSVYERAPEFQPVGAGLQLSPNAVRVLDALGLQLDAAALSSQGVELRDASGGLVTRLDFARHRPRARFALIPRARLIELLATAATAAGVEIHMGADVQRLPEDGIIVGADGLQSRTRKLLNGREVPFFTGQTAWRALIPDTRSAPVAQVFMGPKRHLVSYPLAGGLRNLVAVLERFEWQEEGWNHPDDPDNLRAAFKDFGGPVPSWLAQVKECQIWGLFRHEVAPKWQDGQHVLIGDAAHPTLPFMAQGACMAIEDAWLLAAGLDAYAVPEAMQRFEALRRPRCQKIVEAANANARNYHMTGAKRRVGHAVLGLAGRFAPGALLSRFDWIYDYDPTAEIV